MQQMHEATSDQRTYVEFFYKPIENKAKSRESGRPIFEEREYVKIIMAGSRDIFITPVREVDRKRFAAQYEAFKEGGNCEESGTPLHQWPALGVSQVAELKALNIHTVEQLAALDDHGMQNIGMGARELVAKAEVFIRSAKDAAAAEQLGVELKERDDRIAQLESQLKELAERLEDKERETKKPAATRRRRAAG
uniref:Uncharacterized protein n=1 Tax=Magnetococcus massalia (strain MO-1) TaxID=451514 RepID=A0A1S7LHD5_MAGMO|nr:conserved protein of unknown function [Candidatus Magnetococcus massalia]